MSDTESHAELDHDSARGTRDVAIVRAVPLRHPWRWVAAAVLLVVVAMGVHAVVFARVKRGKVMQDRFNWTVVKQYFLSHQVLDGLLLTLELTAIAMAIGIAGGALLAVMRLSDSVVVRWVSWAFIWFFRGTPVLVQLLFWFSLSYVFPELALGIPFGPELIDIDVNQISPFTLAFVGLGLNEAAYMSEIVRSGIISVDDGQTEAAQALGMSKLRALRRIVLPQAMRVIIPPTGNQTISMLKVSALASVITVTELLYSVQLIYSATYQIVPMLLVASLWYLIVTSVLSVGQFYVERYFGRGSARALPLTPWQKTRRMFASREGLLKLISTHQNDTVRGHT